MQVLNIKLHYIFSFHFSPLQSDFSHTFYKDGYVNKNNFNRILFKIKLVKLLDFNLMDHLLETILQIL
jgi:hypothetical protein